MPSINNIFEIGKSSMFAHQTALSIAGQNIANANTDGYSRKVAILDPSITLMGDKNNSGSGVNVSSISRIRDQYIDNQLSLQKQTLSYWETMDSKHAIIEQIYQEPSDSGLSTIMNQFFESWNDLANNPENPSLRNNVLYKGEALAKKFNFLSDRLTSLQKEITTEMTDEIDKFNAYTKQIADINQKLAYVNDSGGGKTNLLDERDKLLAQMDEIADINSNFNEFGQVNIELNGKVFLQKTHYLTIDSTKIDGDLENVHWSDGSSSAQAEGGKLGALMEIRQTVITENIDKIDAMAKTLVTQVNDVHKAGYGLDGSTGNVFFAETGTTAKSIRLSPDILQDYKKLSASNDTITGSGENALNIYNIQDDLLMSNNSLNITDFYANIISVQGNRKSEASAFAEGQGLFVNTMETYQQSISGVSLDEEMTNLIKFQRGYEAAARLIKMADELTQTILNMVQ